MRNALFFSKKVYGVFQAVCLFFVLPFFYTYRPPVVFAGDKDAYLEELIARASDMRLYEDRYWEILLQYKPSGSGKKSLIDDPKFFLSEDGKVNPEAELTATIEAFFSNSGDENERAQCKFPARYDWLRHRLSIDESRIPRPSCPRLTEAIETIKPKAATLVFPAAHNNSPASMFGHTLIRIDSKPRSDLLSHAATYAAVVNDRSNILYAFKGIFGFYRGYYSNLPYYVKVAEYNDMERRDIWEYELNLTEDEVYRMVLYIWELQDIYSDYYFFDENCSYNLLFLLEAARPSLRLSDAVGNGFRFWVMPVDTIRAMKKSGLVKAVKYRPSKVTRINFMASKMDTALQDVALALSKGRIEPEVVINAGRSEADNRKVLDLAAEVLQYEFSLDRIEKESYLRRYLAVLNARSNLGPGDSDISRMPIPTPPDEGHLPGRVSIGAGYQERLAFTEVSWQPAYHDLTDPSAGYTRGSQIKFMDIKLRHYISADSLKLQSINIIDIVSLADRSKFYKPLSWKVNTGLERMIFDDGKDHLLYRLNFGGGVSTAAGGSGLAYALAEADMKYASSLDSRYSGGVGATCGVLMDLADVWKLHVSGQNFFYMLGDDHRYARYLIEQGISITGNNSLRLMLLWEEGFGRRRSEQSVSWIFFF